MTTNFLFTIIFGLIISILIYGIGKLDEPKAKKQHKH